MRFHAMIAVVPEYGTSHYSVSTNTLTLTKKVGKREVRQSMAPNADIQPRLEAAFLLASKNLPADLVEILRECGLIQDPADRSPTR